MLYNVGCGLNYLNFYMFILNTFCIYKEDIKLNLNEMKHICTSSCERENKYKRKTWKILIDNGEFVQSLAVFRP